MNKAFEGYRSCRLNYGSPSIELDRFYMKPSAEEESAFNLTNLRKLFGQESQDEKEESIRTIAHRQRTKSIWSTDDEDNASNGVSLFWLFLGELPLLKDKIWLILGDYEGFFCYLILS